MSQTLPDPIPQDLAAFGKAVATLREANGLGQIELAEKIQAGSKFTVQEIEAGRPVLEGWLRKLPQALGCANPTLQGIMDEAAGLQEVQKDPKPFGEAVRTLRKEKAWSGSVLAEKIGCGVNTISKIEKGEKVDLKWLHRISAALECKDKTIQGVFDAVAGMTDPLPTDLEHFGRSVTIVRERRAMTQQELGDATIPPCSDTTIGRIENGKPVPEKWLRAMATALKCRTPTMQGLMNEAASIMEQRIDEGLDPATGKPPAPPPEPPAPPKPAKEDKPKREPKAAAKPLPKAPVAAKPTPAPAEAVAAKNAAIWSAIEKHMLANGMDAQELGKRSGIPGNIIESAIKGELSLADNLLARIPPVFGAKDIPALTKAAEDMPAKGGGGKASIDAANIDVTAEHWRSRIRADRARTRGGNDEIQR